MQDAARLQSQQQWVTDPNFKNTTLLLQADNAANSAQNNTFLDSSSNNFAITRNGNTTQGTFTPFSQGWSNYFDQASRLSLDRTAGSFGTNDFTIECWWLASGSQLNYAGIVAQNFSSTNGGWALKVRSTSDQVEFSYINSTPQNVTVSFNVNDGAWHHIAVTRSGTSLRVYVDGILQTTGTLPAAFSFSSGAGNTDIGYQARDNAFIRGYVSNLRLLNGTAFSTGSTYPVATSPLTAVTNTSLLTCQSNRFIDNSSNAYAITVAAGTPSVQPFAPFAPQFQYTQSVIGGSGYFDGSGDYLSVANNAALDLGAGDFCVEAWVYPTGDVAYSGILAKNTAVGDGWNLEFSATRGLIFIWPGASISDAAAYQKNTWQHVVACRSGTTISLYKNGSRVATTTSSTSISYAGPMYVGTAAGGGVFPGYIASARVVKGSSPYSASSTTLTIPTGPLTAITNTTFLCNFTNAGIIDGTMDNALETLGNAQVSTGVVKYGSGSMYFDGSGDRLFISPNQNLAFGSGDFTVECWAYTNSLAASVPIICFGDDAASNGLLLYITTSGRIAIYGNNALLASGTTQLVTTGSWFHLAMSRSGTSLRLFVNGINDGTATNSTSFSSSVLIGAELFTGSIGAQLFGYLDDFRITKGVARYLSNFTPPQVALPRQ